MSKQKVIKMTPHFWLNFPKANFTKCPNEPNISSNNKLPTTKGPITSGKNKPKVKPNLVRRRRILSSCKLKGYKMNLDFWPKNPKANFLKNRVIVSSGKIDGYETDLDFSLKNAKANSKPISAYCLAPNFTLGVLFLAKLDSNDTFHKWVITKY
jgi:hypothetical protein